MKKFLFILLFPFLLFCDVKINAPKSYIKGEPYIFTIELSAKKIEDFNIEKIDNFLVSNIASSTSIVNNNFEITKKVLKKYVIYPTKEFEIPKLKFILDDKEYQTKAIKVTEKIPSQTKINFASFEILSSKKEVYVGEAFKVKLKFAYKNNLNIASMNLQKVEFDNFWVKNLEKNNKQYNKDDYVVQELQFLLFAQKQGDLKIEPLRIDMSLIDKNTDSYFPFSAPTKKVKIYSNSLSIKARKASNETNIVGEDIKLETFLDKKDLLEKGSFNFKIKISGYGNFDDIEDIKLDLKQATVYDNKPEIKTSLKDGKYYGVFTKSFSIVPNESLSIKPINFKYFDIEKKKLKILSSKEYFVKYKTKKKEEHLLQKAKKQEAQEVQEKIVLKKLDYTSIIMYIFLGVLLTLLIIGLYFYGIKIKTKKALDEKTIIKKIKASKNKHELLNLTCVHLKKFEAFDKLVYKLEKSSKDDFKQIKKEFVQIIKNNQRIFK